jgi:hypothetical protein
MALSTIMMTAGVRRISRTDAAVAKRSAVAASTTVDAEPARTDSR